jgi:hypothetical protein
MGSLSQGPVVQIYMPPAYMIPQDAQGWSQLTDSYTGLLKAAIANATGQGATTIEVLQREDMGTLGYADSFLFGSHTEDNVEAFTESLGHALNKLEVEQPDTITVNVIAGSNGGRAFTNAIVNLGENGELPVNQLTLVDPRSYADTTKNACSYVQMGCSVIVNTGDYPATPLVTVADANVAQSLASDNIRVFKVSEDVLGSSFLPDFAPWDVHIADMTPDDTSQPSLSVSEWRQSEWVDLGRTNHAGLLALALNPDSSGAIIQGPTPIDTSGASLSERFVNTFGGTTSGEPDMTSPAAQLPPPAAPVNQSQPLVLQPPTNNVTIVSPTSPNDSEFAIPSPGAGASANPLGAPVANPNQTLSPQNQQIQDLEQAIGSQLTGPTELQPLPEPSQSIRVEGPYYSDDGGNTWKLVPSSDETGNALPSPPSGSLDVTPSDDLVTPDDLRAQLDELREKAAQADQNLQDAENALRGAQSQGTPQGTYLNQSISDIANISGINPDFIAALQRCAQAEAQYSALPSDSNFYNVMTCDKNSDGSYISAFGAQSNTPATVGSAQRGSFWNSLGSVFQTLNELNTARKSSGGTQQSQPAGQIWSAYVCNAMAERIALCKSCPPPSPLTGPSLCELSCKTETFSTPANYAAHCASGKSK